ncbi:MAG: serine/threonine-protein kinase [Planctomycetota bacterium]
MNEPHDPSSAESEDERIFGEALTLPPAERAAHVLRASQGRRELAGRVLDLLAAHATAGSFLETPAVRPKGLDSVANVREGPGTVIGPYELIEELGEGGFGVVYRARQLEPVRREVALKVIKLGMDTRQVIARFEAERQALAVLDHPHIARVLDAGATDTGRPYFVMELVDGVDITKYCDQQKLDTHARIRLFIDVCDALQHAHQRGLIHRDLKPSNILVTLRDGKHVPKVIDFGIAKATTQRLTERTVFTELGQFIGTPVYMSPEQAEHGEAEVDTRSDIYSLGVVLYELLTGGPPFEAKELRDRGLAEIQTFIREHEPLPPSGRVTRLGVEGSTVALARGVQQGELITTLRGEADWIVMKALEKERERRYESAAAFGQDLGRFLDNMPVLAGPPSVVYRMRKFVRRHRIAVGAGAIVLLALVAGVALMLVGFVEARRNAEIARAQNEALSDVVATLGSNRAGQFSLDEAARVVESFERAYGANHPGEAGVRRLLAERLEEAGRTSEAIEEFKRALEHTARVHGDCSPEHVLLMGQLGMLMQRNGLNEDAEPMLGAALAVEAAAFGRKMVQMNAPRLALADVKQGKGDIDGALALNFEALEIVKAEQPDNQLGILRTAQACLMRASLNGRDSVLGPVWLDFLQAIDQLYPDGASGRASSRGDVRLQLVQWNVEAKVFPQEAILTFLREAIAAYQSGKPEVAKQRSAARSLLAETLLERGGPGDVDEALAGVAAAIEDVRQIPNVSGRVLTGALDSAADRYEAHGRLGAAIEAQLEVITLRRELEGAAAEVRKQKDALERLAQALFYDKALPQGHPDFAIGIRAVAFLQAEAPSDELGLYDRLHDALTLRSGNYMPALRRVGGLFGRNPRHRDPKHPYTLALAAFAANLADNKTRAHELLDEATELAARPEYSNDMKSKEMLAFVRQMIGKRE